MKVQTFTVNPIQENCYLLWDEETREAAIIDCGASSQNEWNTIHLFIEENQLQMQYSLQTHMHFDHILGLPYVRKEYDLRPLCHQDEQRMYDAAPLMSQMFGMKFDKDMPGILRYLKDGETLLLGGQEIRVIHTPGHTPGGLCYYLPAQGILFTGDTVFRGSVGRTDLPGGNMEEELQSIQEKIMALPDQTIVYPGHGPSSSIGWERENNPYFRI